MKNFFTKERLRTIVCVVLSFFICLGVFAITICADLLVVSSPNFAVSAAQKSNYSKYAVNQLTEELNDLAIPSGLPENFFTGKIDEDEFNTLFFTVLENTIRANKDYKLSLEDFNTQVLNMVTEYSKNEVGDFSENVEKDIVRFANECENIYLSYINPSLLSYSLTVLNSSRKYVNIALVLSAVFVLIIGIVLFRLNYVSSFIKYCFTIFGGAALAAGVIPAYLLATNEISRISISSKSLYAVVTTYAQQILWVILISAIILASVAFILLLIKIFTLIFRK